MFRKLIVVTSSDLVQLAGACGCCNELRFPKLREISWLAKKLLTSQKGIYSTELVCYFVRSFVCCVFKIPYFILLITIIWELYQKNSVDMEHCKCRRRIGICVRPHILITGGLCKIFEAYVSSAWYRRAFAHADPEIMMRIQRTWSYSAERAGGWRTKAKT
jgi:hypothetical protein